MLSEVQIKSAITIGNTQANEVISFRNEKLKKRALAISEKPQLLESPVIDEELQPQLIHALGPESNEVIVAEGDSWFDYPFHDILKILEDDHGYDVESVAQKGDRVEDMAYSGGQLENFTRRIEKLLRKGNIPRAILLSGGGNDVAGDEFGMLLNHKSSGMPGLNSAIVDGIINERIMASYLTIISKVSSICKQRLAGC